MFACEMQYLNCCLICKLPFQCLCVLYIEMWYFFEQYTICGHNATSFDGNVIANSYINLFKNIEKFGLGNLYIGLNKFILPLWKFFSSHVFRLMLGHSNFING